MRNSHYLKLPHIGQRWRFLYDDDSFLRVQRSHSLLQPTLNVTLEERHPPPVVLSMVETLLAQQREEEEGAENFLRRLRTQKRHMQEGSHSIQHSTQQNHTRNTKKSLPKPTLVSEASKFISEHQGVYILPKKKSMAPLEKRTQNTLHPAEQQKKIMKLLLNKKIQIKKQLIPTLKL